MIKDTKEIREQINKLIDLELEAIPYYDHIKELSFKVKHKLEEQGLLEEGSYIKDAYSNIEGDIIIFFTPKGHTCTGLVTFFFKNYSQKTSSKIKELLKSVIIEIFLYKKLYEKYKELKNKASYIQEHLEWSSRELRTVKTKLQQLKYFTARAQRKILEEERDYLATLPNEALY